MDQNWRAIGFSVTAIFLDNDAAEMQAAVWPLYSLVLYSADIWPAVTDVRLWQILLQKSFWGEEQKFLEPLMRFTRGDVRDHIVSSKIDQGPPWR